MTPSPLPVPKERSDLLPDGNSAPTTLAVAAAMAISPHAHSGDITRIGYDHSARRHAASSPALCGAAGCSPRSSGAIAAPASWLLELSTDLQERAFTDHPNGLAPRMGVAASIPGSASAASAGKRLTLLSLEHPRPRWRLLPQPARWDPTAAAERVRPRRPCPPLAPAWSALGRELSATAGQQRTTAVIRCPGQNRCPPIAAGLGSLPALLRQRCRLARRCACLPLSRVSTTALLAYLGRGRRGLRYVPPCLGTCRGSGPGLLPLALRDLAGGLLQLVYPLPGR